MCVKGSYCPRGSSVPTPCDRGKHCDVDKLDYPSGNCTAGYYCNYSSTSPTPKQCPLGHYCPAATKLIVECPCGTFNGFPGMSLPEHCSNCTAGYYCPYPGMNAAIFRCLQGYYCPEGSRENNTMECPEGYYCPTGSGKPIACPPG